MLPVSARALTLALAVLARAIRRGVGLSTFVSKKLCTRDDADEWIRKFTRKQARALPVCARCDDA
jgi:hypothetical protein